MSIHYFQEVFPVSLNVLLWKAQLLTTQNYLDPNVSNIMKVRNPKCLLNYETWMDCNTVVL